MKTTVIVSSLIAGLLAGCTSDPGDPDPKAGGATPAVATAPDPAPAPALDTAPEAALDAAPAAEPSAPVEATPYVFTAQDGWREEPPSSGMRRAQYVLPAVEEGADDATLVVYHFGPGGGGDLEANLDRWASQFEQPDGVDTRELLEPQARVVNGVALSVVDLDGTYVAETRPGSGERLRKERWRMLAAIVDAPEGAYYVKLVGPEGTIAHWEASFVAFLDAIRPAS
jgi:hypothetical protein